MQIYIENEEEKKLSASDKSQQSELLLNSTQIDDLIKQKYSDPLKKAVVIIKENIKNMKDKVECL